MLNLKKIRFGNVGRFVTPQEIDFSSKKRLVQINGLFVDTGGSSGAGKSTVIEMMDYVLGINKSSATTLQSRYTKEPMWAEAEYESGDNTFTISRIKDKGLKVSWTGPDGDGEISGNVALAEEKITKILGLDPDLFRRMTHKAQKEDGFFLSLTPKESFGFLIKVMGMDDMLKKLDKLDIFISHGDKKVASLQTELQAIGSKVNDQSEILNKLNTEPLPEKPDISILDNQKNEIQTKASNLIALSIEESSKLEAIKTDTNTLLLAFKANNEPQRPSNITNPARVSEIDIEILKIEVEAKNLENAKSDKVSQIQKALDILRQQKQSSEYIARYANAHTTAIENKKKELEHLNARNCPTCLQKWIGLDMEAKVSALRGEVDQLHNKLLESENEKAKIPDLLEKISRTETILTTIKDTQPSADAYIKAKELKEEKDILIASTNAQNQVAMDIYIKENASFSKELEEIRQAYSIKADEIRKKYSATKSTIELNLSDIKAEVSRLELAKVQYDSMVSAREKNLETNNEYLKKYLEALDSKNSEYQLAQQQFLVHQEAKRLLKSYTNKMFEEALETIGRNATERLNKIPNMNTASVYFESFKEVKGKIKEEISVIVSMDGDIGIPIKSLSGGERSAADLAVDLAVADFIEEHSGMGANYLLLDEPLSGMDASGKACYIEMLQTMGTNKQIFIVDHSTEIKEMVPDCITIIREGLYSRVE